MIISAQNECMRNRFGERRSLEMMKEAGFTGLDFTVDLMDDFDEVVMGPGAMKKAAEIRDLTADVGIPIVGAHAPFEFRSGMAMDESEPKFRRLVRAIEFAGACGAPLIVTHALKLPQEEWLEDVEEEQKRTFDLNIKWYGILEPYARKAGIRIAVENLCTLDRNGALSTRLLGDAKSYTAMLDALDPAVFTGCFDVGHAHLSTHDAPSFIREAGKYIHFLHIHDNNGKTDAHLMPAFRELEAPSKSKSYTIRWKEVAEALRDIRYDGPFNYEITTWYRTFSDALLPEALALSVKAAEPMMRIIEGTE